jgi:aspartyl-tRNA(Asn)/glutamyl-tRNA(Gln) amidotransferase subunit A
MTNKSELLTIENIAEGFRNLDFTPSEILDIFLTNIEQLTEINAFIEVYQNEAKAKAHECDKIFKEGKSSDILSGIPISLKDIFLVKDKICTCGSKMLSNYVSNYDSMVSSRLAEKGAILLGKTNMDEFAMGSSTETSYFGPTLNPWDFSRVPGGSSGGSAASVAGKLAVASIGTDTGGSIRQPASFCGVVGLKPTYGRISRYGMIAFASSLDQAGPLTINVADSAILIDALSGFDDRDSTSLKLPPTNCYRALKDKKFTPGDFNIGIPYGLLKDGLDPEIENNFNILIDKLKSIGFSIKDVSLPNSKYAVAVYYIIAPSEASSNLSRYDGVRYGFSQKEPKQSLDDFYVKNRTEGFGDEVKRRIMLGTYALSSGYYDAYYLKAIKVKKMVENDFAAAFKDVDCILTPTSPELPFKLGEKKGNPLSMYLSDILTIPANLAQLPSISIPFALSASGLPIGAQLTSKRLDEESLLKVSSILENEVGFNNKL